MSIINPGDWLLDANTVDGTELAARLNRLKIAIFSNNANASRPADIAAGGIWTRNTSATTISLMLYDGTHDIEIAVVDTTSGALVVSGSGTSVGPSAPANPFTGQTWFNPSNDLLKLWNGTVWVDPVVAAASAAQATADAAQAAADYATQHLGFKNILINGEVTRINQRGVANWAAVANGAYGYDRWKKVDASNMTQIIEQGNFVPGAVYTLSGTGVTTQQLTAPASGNWTLPNIPITATNIQLEFGNVATLFEKRSVALELSMCQRYFFYLPFTVSFLAGSSGQVVVNQIIFPTQMRVAPTPGELLPDPDRKSVV